MGTGRTEPAAGSAQRLRSPTDSPLPCGAPAAPPGAAGHRVPSRPPRTEPSRSGSRRPLPGAPHRTKPPAALTGSLSPSSALAHRSSSRWKSRRRGAGWSAGGYPAPQPIQRRRPGVLLAATVAAPRLTPSAPATGSGLISKLPRPPPPGRAEESVKPLLHAAPAAQPLPQPLPGEAWPGSGLVLTVLSFPSLLHRPPAPEAGKEGEERLTTRICLWNGAKESSRITAPGRRRQDKGVGGKKKKERKKNPLLFSRRENRWAVLPSLVCQVTASPPGCELYPRLAELPTGSSPPPQVWNSIHRSERASVNELPNCQNAKGASPPRNTDP